MDWARNPHRATAYAPWSFTALTATAMLLGNSAACPKVTAQYRAVNTTSAAVSGTDGSSHRTTSRRPAPVMIRAPVRMSRPEPAAATRRFTMTAPAKYASPNSSPVLPYASTPRPKWSWKTKGATSWRRTIVAKPSPPATVGSRKAGTVRMRR